MPDVGRGGQNGRGRGGNQVDRATWRLVTALTRQQARRGRQALFHTLQAALMATVPTQAAVSHSHITKTKKLGDISPDLAS